MAERESAIESFLGDKSRLEGTLTFEGSLTLFGKFKGKIKGGEGVVLGESSESEAEVEAGHMAVHGKVVGKIRGGKRVEVHRNAEIEADILTPTLVIHEGALLEGKCSMKRQSGRRGSGKIVDLKEGWIQQD